jgi:hypothetical protein
MPPLVPSTIKKGTDPAGTSIRTFNNGAGGPEVQGIIQCDENGNILSSASSGTVPATVSVGTTATELFVASTTRVGFLIHNHSDADVYLGFTTGVTTANGIRLFPGSSYEQRGMGVYQGAVHAIVATSTADVRIQVW